MPRSAPPRKRSSTKTRSTPAKAPRSRKPSEAPLPPDDVRPLALAAVDAALDKKAEHPTLLDVRRLSGYADYVLIVTGDSERQLEAIAREITDRLRTKGKRVRGVEAAAASGWVLMDFGDLVVHVFFREAREFYDLEGLWADAPRVGLAGH